MTPRDIFITGGTGYVGSGLIPLLQARGHRLRVLARNGSKGKVPQGCTIVEGNALQAAGFVNRIAPADTFVQLVGVSHPSPAKARLFREVDLVSARESIAAAMQTGIQHFVYVSVAQPAPMMKEYIAVRAEAEAILRSSGLNATILRPWYVLGPGHRWPVVLTPFYRCLEWLPATRESARRLGLVTIRQMLATLINVIELPATGIRILEVPQIREQSGSVC